LRRLQGIQGLTSTQDREEWLPVVDEFVVHQRWEDLDPAVPLLAASNMASNHMVNWINNGRPIIATNRPHIGGWAGQYRSNARRFSVNGYACTTWGHRDHSRFALLGIEQHPWKVKHVRKILIAPPGKLLYFWHNKDATEWAHEQARFFDHHPVEVRYRWKYDNRKGKKGRYRDLWQDLDWADLVISWGSAITAEAFYYGKKVISMGPCATWVCCDRTLDNWDDPSEPPGRAEWHEHMAWTQFTRDEMAGGKGAEMIIQYQGWPVPGE
jgi:hypothetical protein